MPTTPLGTPYSVFGTAIGSPVNGSVGWGLPDSLIGTQHIPLMFYCHGAGGSSTQFRNDSAWAGLRNWLMDNGWAWVESTGGSTYNWGNQGARDGYDATWEHIKAQMSIGPVVILGRSMGGLIAYWLYTQHPELSDPAVCQGLIINSGVTDLVAMNAAGQYDSTLPPAYGLTAADGDAAFNAAVAGGWDPMDYATSLWTDRRVLQCWATNDTTVPPLTHGQAWRTAYGSFLDVNLGANTASGGHGDSGAYTLVSDMSDFLTDCAAEWVAPEPEPEILGVTQIFCSRDGVERIEPVAMYYQVDETTRVKLSLPGPWRYRPPG